MTEHPTFSVPDMIRELDELYNAGREQEAEAFLCRHRELAQKAGDWRSELSVLSELMGHYRRDRNEKAGMAAVEQGLALIREHELGESISGATIMLNAATTLKCFGFAERSMTVFRHVALVYEKKLSGEDARLAGLYNNMALSCGDLQDFAGAERYFRQALEVLDKNPGGENERAVTLCNLAELYHRQNPEDPRIAACVEGAWQALNAPGLARDGYHAFTISKCAPSFDYLGFFFQAAELRERAEAIYAGNR